MRGAQGVVVGGLIMLAGVAPAAAEPVVRTYAFTGAPETFTVPDGVTAVTVRLDGAQGGLGCGRVEDAPGGLGATLVATLPVQSGETLEIRLGGQPIASCGGAGGYNGGGSSSYGARGGGASDVRTAANGRVLVAGGGGGGGNSAIGWSPAAGGAGGASDAPGADGGGPNAMGGSGGASGSSGGKGGAGGAGGTAGGDGTPEGTGGGSTAGIFGAGGGGGGGWVGGGAGGAGGNTPSNGNGSGGGGGGGSSHAAASATNVSITQGAHQGAGQVVISYEPPAPPAAPTDTGTGASGSGGSTQETPPVTEPQQVVLCEGRKVALTDLRVAGRTLLVRGLALDDLAGRSVTITADHGAGSFKTTIARDGSFVLRVPKPRSRQTSYRAVIDGSRSAPLKVSRHIGVLAQRKVKAGLRIVVAHTAGKRVAGQTATLRRQIGCGVSEVAGTARFDRHGRVTFVLAKPTPPSTVAVYRVTSRRNNTYTLPIVVRR